MSEMEERNKQTYVGALRRRHPTLRNVPKGKFLIFLKMFRTPALKKTFIYLAYDFEGLYM